MNRISSRTLAFGAVFTLLLTLVTVFAPNQASAAGGTISLRSHVCPATYDGPEASISGLAANCQAVGAQIPVSIVQGITQIDQSSTNLDGTLNYVGFSGGEIVIDQTAPAGTSVRAFCAIYSDTSGDRTYREYANPIDELLQTGESFDCEIYNVPYASVVQGSVYVNKHNCPVGFDVYGADMYGLATVCHEAAADGTAFTLSDTANPAIPGTTASGIVSWSGVPASAIAISESTPIHYYPARVFCNFKNANGDESGFSEYFLTSNIINLNAQAGYDTFCDWYDLHLAPGTVVTGLGANNQVATVIATDSNATDTGNSSATDAGNASAPDLNGNSSAATPISGQTPTASNGNADLTFSVTDCPAGYDVLSEKSDPKTDCAGVANDPFTISGAGLSPATTSPDAQGSIDFPSLAAGRYEIAEALPAGVTSAFIGSCQSSKRSFDSVPFTPLNRIGSSGRLVLNLLDGEKLNCSWYNVPAKSSTAAGTSIKISALTCPGSSVVLAQCAPDASGVAFTFTPSDASADSPTLTADVNGVAVGRIKPGTYALAGSNGRFCFVDSPAFDGNGNLVVANDAIAVSLYTCGK